MRGPALPAIRTTPGPNTAIATPALGAPAAAPSAKPTHTTVIAVETRTRATPAPATIAPGAAGIASRATRPRVGTTAAATWIIKNAVPDAGAPAPAQHAVANENTVGQSQKGAVR